MHKDDNYKRNNTRHNQKARTIVSQNLAVHQLTNFYGLLNINHASQMRFILCITFLFLFSKLYTPKSVEIKCLQQFSSNA